MSDSFLLQAIIYLGSAIICVPIAKKLGLSSIIGYLFAGILIGPSVLGWIGDKSSDIMHFAEFGVVMMLFIIGLELDSDKFWRLRKLILGSGSLQIVATTLLLFGGFYVFLDWNWQASLSVALALSLSSTAIVLQTLKEKNLDKSRVGRSSFAVLLFQDIAVIPILALIPLLASGTIENTPHSTHDLLKDSSAIVRTLAILSAMSLLYVISKYAIVKLLHLIAEIRLQELFTATALLLVLGVSYLMEFVGLSPALGAFVAGVVLANSEFKHELEGDIAPFKGLLLGLFFLGVGATINIGFIIDKPVSIVGFVFALMAVKTIVLLGIGKLYGKKIDENLLYAALLSQAGEFGFVILSFAVTAQVIEDDIAQYIYAAIALSMLVSPFLLLLLERRILPFIGTKKTDDFEPTPEIEEENPVIIAGFGHFGSTVGRLLSANNIPVTVLDHDAERVDLLRKMGFKVYYGDATRLEMLEAAGIEKARLFIAAIDNPDLNIKLAHIITKHYPNIKVLSRARNRNDAYELLDLGIKDYFRETLYTAVEMGVAALTSLGIRKYTAKRQALEFVKHDEKTTLRLAEQRHDKKAYLITAKEEIELMESVLKKDLNLHNKGTEHAWDSSFMRLQTKDKSK
ncbi:MAG: monovalent cation:proton antiporter-2 (CPA2) family protein [Flavobacteriaceae bacterium]|nr:monovalent cation:proton antiporter-2 (CPA2) family protein [Flavobacteriaceae bacterium]